MDDDLSPELIESAKRGLAQAERGEFLTPAEVTAMWDAFREDWDDPAMDAYDNL